MMRRLAPKTATSIAEYFRDQGRSVCLVVDSIARLAQAERDIAISNGELPIARGYPPSVIGAIAKLLERAGPGTENSGTITAFYTVLVDGDDHNDPIADHIRGTLDGHIVLSRSIAETGRYPAVDILKSISRLAPSLWTQEQQALIRALKELIYSYEDSHDLRMIGAYTKGSNATLDQAIEFVPSVYQYLSQTAAADLTIDPFHEIAQMLTKLR
jgi:flagellum-specific ATP synthase